MTEKQISTLFTIVWSILLLAGNLNLTIPPLSVIEQQDLWLC